MHSCSSFPSQFVIYSPLLANMLYLKPISFPFLIVLPFFCLLNENSSVGLSAHFIMGKVLPQGLMPLQGDITTPQQFEASWACSRKLLFSCFFWPQQHLAPAIHNPENSGGPTPVPASPGQSSAYARAYQKNARTACSVAPCTRAQARS